ncbi:MAG: CYTH domain-containing protein [Candidatus Uhrbacteria bacterium]|nr:CYTH domain-containing protein [Candidatus Uhrbacteria bacterium]
MIEVEKKFRLTPEQEKRLLEGATFLRNRTNEDVYYDMDDFSLTRQDHWLRTRSGRWELKRRVHELGHKLGGTAYDEIEDEPGIRAFLQLPEKGSLADDLAQAGYKPFARIVTERCSYEKEGFHIDLDICDSGYELAEIELMLEHEDQRQDALKRIEEFAARMGLDQAPVRGKIIEHLYRFALPHYDALVEAGVI